jgi:hypothetical protein
MTAVAKMTFTIPVIGWLLRDLIYGKEDAPFWFGASYVLAWMASVVMFGLPALVTGALGLVPVMFGLILAITWVGKL